ncbi:EKC/KEOPS complex subunit GON7 [Ascaphus truei]|uniref:EKC/KEOPS complex subunit GON7 n=1 Tax=Ascaphus truei TaxID=8439 RepID=UPI003F59CD7E
MAPEPFASSRVLMTRFPACRMELRAELSGRDGTRRPFQVTCERTLQGMVSGLEQLKREVSAVLSELVLQEKGERRGAGGQESADDEEDEEEDNPENKTRANGPPSKRTKKMGVQKGLLDIEEGTQNKLPDISM